MGKGGAGSVHGGPRLMRVKEAHSDSVRQCEVLVLMDLTLPLQGEMGQLQPCLHASGYWRTLKSPFLLSNHQLGNRGH